MVETDEPFTSIMEGSDLINDLLNEIASTSNINDQDATTDLASDTEESLSPEEVIRRLDAITLMTDTEEKAERFDEDHDNYHIEEEKSSPLPSTDKSPIIPPPVAFNVNVNGRQSSEQRIQEENKEYRSEDDADQFISSNSSDIAEVDIQFVGKENTIIHSKERKVYDETMSDTPIKEYEEAGINHEETDQFTPEDIVSHVEKSELTVQNTEKSASCEHKDNETEPSATNLETQKVDESTMFSEKVSVLTTETQEMTSESYQELANDIVEIEALDQWEDVENASSAVSETIEASDSDSESESETDEPLHPPLNLGTTLGNDSDEELEVDEEVAASLLKEQSTKKPAISPALAPPKAIVQSVSKIEESFNPLADALSAAINATENSKTKAQEEQNDDPFSSNSFSSKSKGIEVRVAAMTVPDPVLPATSSKESIENSFGIAYKNTRKKKLDNASENNIGYTLLPSKPLFPDEKEFEKDLEASTLLQQAVSFSTQSCIKNKNQKEENKVDKADEVDEFDAVFVEATGDLISNLSTEKELDLKRQRMKKKAAAEAQELLQQLKKETVQERKEIELETRLSAIEAEATAANTSATQSAAAVLEAQAAGLSLSDIHSMYKRGLGDQEVHMLDDENSKTSTSTSSAKSGNKPVIAPVLGAILKEPIKNEIIEEEEEEEEKEDDEEDAREGKKVVTKDHPVLPQMEKEDEWTEIQLSNATQNPASTTFSSAPMKTSPASIEAPMQSLPSSATALLKYNTAASYFFEDPELLSQHCNKIVPEDFKFKGCMGTVLNPKLKFTSAKDQRDRVFCIAISTYDPRNDIHRNLLQTIYKKLMKTQRDVGAIGPHWEEIGFQGTDPSTDLRGCGLLSLLQLLYLVEKHMELAGKLHTLSHHPVRHFPMACTLINATLQCLVTLRSGKLYRQCNKTRNVMDAMNLLYVAITKRLHEEIKQDSNEAIPLIMKRVFEEAKGRPDKMIDEIYKTPSTRTSTTRSSNKSNTTRTSTQLNISSAFDGDIEFTEIGLHKVEE